MPVVSDGLTQTRGQGALGGGQLEREDEVGDLDEVRAQVGHLLYDVLQTDDLAPDVLLDLGVGLDCHPLVPHLPVQLLVYQLAHQFLRGLAPGDVVLNALEETDVGGVALHEDSSVDLAEVELGEDEALLARDVVGASYPDDDQELANAVDVLLFPLEVEALVLPVLGKGGVTLSL